MDMITDRPDMSSDVDQSTAIKTAACIIKSGPKGHDASK